MTYQEDNVEDLQGAELDRDDMDINLSQSQTPASSKFVSPVVDRSHPRRSEARFVPADQHKGVALLKPETVKNVN